MRCARANSRIFVTLEMKISAMTITVLHPEHWPIVKAIYEDGLATGNASFQTSAPSWEEWDDAHLKHSRLVALDGDTVTGWAALTPVSGRCVYAGVAEVSVYIDAAHRGRGIGQALLQALITESEANGLWTLQAGIFPENIASIQLHEKCGFRLLATREKIGQHNGIWRDTVLFERRSKKVGTTAIVCPVAD
jgi:L-amino acid N-acyltransferase YncA